MCGETPSRSAIAVVGLAALLLAVTITSAAAAGPAGGKKLIVITSKNLPQGTFVLDSSQTGAIKPDTGTTRRSG